MTVAARRTPRAVTVIGPECTGKTTLAARLAAALHTVASPEGARCYVEAQIARGMTPQLTAADVEPIARTQLDGETEAEREAADVGASLVVRDTDLVSTVLYARHYYGHSPQWIEDAARARRASLYLLCDVDLAWDADGVRDAAQSSDDDRAAMLAAFAAALDEFDCPFVLVRGTFEQRPRMALAAIADALGGG